MDIGIDKIVKDCDFDNIFERIGEGKLYRLLLSQIEKPLIEWSLKRTWGNQIKAAKILG